MQLLEARGIQELQCNELISSLMFNTLGSKTTLAHLISKTQLNK